MKKNINSNFLTLLVLGLIVPAFFACKSSKKTMEKPPEGEVAITEYCAGTEYMSDKKFFRASNLGESQDQATAKKKAMANARADLASSISTTMQGVIDNYVNSREFNNREEVEERFEGLTREVLDQELRGVKVICSQPTKTSEGRYKYYIALELSGDELVSEYNERISADERLKIDYDYEKFKKTFEEEMERQRNN